MTTKTPAKAGTVQKQNKNNDHPQTNGPITLTSNQAEQPQNTNTLHPLGEKIFLDRYALKDAKKESIVVGDLVIVAVNLETGQRELGTVSKVEGRNLTIQLRDGDVVERALENVDKPLETHPAQMLDRVARGLAVVETRQKQEEWTQKFRWLLDDWKFIPGGRILAAAGTNQNLSFYNCHVIPSPQDSRGGIMTTLTQMTEIMSRGGGVGINISSLRPHHAYVKGVNGRSSGSVSWGELYSFVTGLIEQGGCLTPNTLIFTENGLLRLDEIVTHQQPGWHEQTLSVMTDEGERLSRQVFNNGLAEVLRVETDMGLPLTGTPNHKVKVMTASGPQWRRLAELQTGEAIIVKLGQHQGKYQPLRKPSQKHHNQDMVEFPPILDEELAFFLGYFSGDGFMTGQEGDWRLGVAVSHDTYLIDEMPTLLQRLFPGVNVRVQQKENDASLVYLISNRAVKEFLQLNGFAKAQSRAVCVPRLIRQSPPEVVGAFLRGLFEADGAVSHHYPTLCSTSKSLIDEVAVLLIGLGCPVKIEQQPASDERYGDNPVWRLRVHSFRGLENWRHHIGCDAQSRFAVCLDFAPDKIREVSYKLPHPEYWLEPVIGDMRLPQLDQRATGQRFKATDQPLQRKLLRYLRGDRNLTLSAYDTLNQTHPAFAKTARPVNDMWFVFVDKVRPAGQSLTLDLEVAENHTYLANGLVTHNSRRGALMLILNVWHPDVLEFITSKRTMGRITNANISVGITDDFMAAVKADGDWDLVFPDTSYPDYDQTWDGNLETWQAAGKPVVVHKTVKAREVWHSIIESAWASAEPGVWFMERSNKMSNSWYFNPLVSTNPCVTGDTLIYTAEGMMSAAELFAAGNAVEVVLDRRFGQEQTTALASAVFKTGTKPVYRLQTKEGYYLRATANHQIMTPRGWVALQDLEPGEAVHSFSYEGSALENLVATVESITADGVEDVYDLTEPLTHSFIGNGLVLHNCGEQPLAAWSVCNLGALNLAKFVSDGAVDWNSLGQGVRYAVRFLDNVIDSTPYFFEENAEQQLNERRVGLGTMGLAEMMIRLKIRYGSPESTEFLDKLYKFIASEAYLASADNAVEKGVFTHFDTEKFLQSGFMRGMPDEVREAISEKGIRNVTLLTQAPTGTTGSMVNTSTGIEPFYFWNFQRKGRMGTHEERVLVYDEWLTQHPDQPLPDYFVTAMDLAPEDHVRVQAAIQRWIDSSISKCVTGDTLILTHRGLIPIAELSDMRQPGQFEPLEIDIVTPSGIEKTDAFYYAGMQETRRVLLSFGYRIEGTPDHRVHKLDPDGHICFARLDEIRVGDTIVLYSGQQVFSPAGQPLPIYSGSWHVNAKQIRFPEKMLPELAYLLGCITSEGCISQNGVSIANGDKALLERLSTLLKELFGLDSSIYQDKRRSSLFSLQINSRPFRHWLLNDLRLKAGAENKIIPTCILRASRHEIVAFLRGLMLDSYMTLDGRMFGIGLASQILLHQFQTLLLNFGVVSRIHQNSERAWALTVSGQALELLATFIEFDEIWKAERIEHRNEGRVVKPFNYATLMPRQLTEELRQMQISSSKSLRSLYDGNTAEYQRARVNLLEGNRMKRQMATPLYQHFDDTHNDYVDRFFETDQDGCVYVEVKAIERGFAEIFDLSVPGSHTFIANGLGNHNTCNTPNSYTVEQTRELYELMYELGCKGGTIYRDGSRDVQVLNLSEEKTPALSAGSPEQSRRVEGPALSAVEGPPEAKWRARPATLHGNTYRKNTPIGTAYITINANGGGNKEPFEVFINVGKVGSDVAADAEGLGRLVSLILRMPSPLSPTERVQDIVAQLRGIGSGRAQGFGKNRVMSLPDAVAQALAEHVGFSSTGDLPGLPDEDESAQLRLILKGDLCPGCGSATLLHIEGCKKCHECGYSEC